MKRGLVMVGLALALAAGAGFLTSQAVSGSNAAAVRTVTITLHNGATGPRGAQGPPGPAGSASCPAGFEPGELVINHPGGQVTIATCLKR